MRCWIPDQAEQPVAGWLALLQTVRSEAESYSHCSAGQIHSWSGLPPAVPLYDSILVVENYPVDTITATPAGGESFTVVEAKAAGAHTGAALTLLAGPGRCLQFRAMAGEGRWDAGSLGRFLDGFQMILRRLVTAESMGDLRRDLPAAPVLAALPTGPGSREAAVAPRTVEELRLVGIWEEVLGVTGIGVRDSFFELGGHSLLALRFVDRYEREFGHALPLHALLESPTIESLGDRLRSAPGRFSPLVPLQVAGGGSRMLFCVHPLGGNVLCYAELARLLQGDYRIYGLQARGVEDGDPPATDLDAMAADYLAHVRAVQPEGPYTLLGYSFGGFVALRMAALLRDAGEQVDRVILLDVPHPSVVPPEMARTDESGLLVSLFAGSLELSVESLRAMGSEERLRYVFEQAREAGLLPPGMSYERALRYFAISRANHEMGYQPFPFGFPVTLVRASDLADRLSPLPDLGWSAHAAELEVVWSPGSHETMMNPPQVAVLAECIRGSER